MAVALAAALCAGSAGVQALQPDASSGVPVVALASLPVQATETVQRIRRGGPFPYSKDGVVFGNRERLLPALPADPPAAQSVRSSVRSGWKYREYTVPTPGVAHRGARRVVCGGQRPAEPDVCFYTADHYASFTRIAP